MLFGESAKKHDSGKQFKRLVVDYSDTSHRFRHVAQDYSKQFFHIYSARLNKMGPLIKARAIDKWGTEIPIKTLAELSENDPGSSIIVGTLCKIQSLAPSILKEVCEENQLEPQPIRSNFVDDGDKLILEDELQRIRLCGQVDVHTVVTGIVCAVKGYEGGDGKFKVEDMVFCEGSGRIRELSPIDEAPLMILISGLDLASSNDNATALNLLQHWMYGNLIGFNNEENDWEAANIVRIIVAGNSVRSSQRISKNILGKPKPDSANILPAMRQADTIFHSWSKSVYVDVMSGEFDPSNLMLPQQPMHQCMFAKSIESNSFKCVTNPYSCTIAGRFILGTSGQNVTNIQKFSKLEDPLVVLESTLKWGHIAPTCPDSLPCYPYYSEDPFVLEKLPHVYFAGGCEEFKTGLYKDDKGEAVRLVCVPSFNKTNTVAVINLQTLECRSMEFGIKLNI